MAYYVCDVTVLIKYMMPVCVCDCMHACVCVCVNFLFQGCMHGWAQVWPSERSLNPFFLQAQHKYLTGTHWQCHATFCQNICAKPPTDHCLTHSVADCQYTCHLQCVPSVTLDCTTVSPGSGQGPVATPTDLPSPSASAETSLTERRTIVTRSPQKQQQQPQPASAAYSELSAQAAPQSVQHLGPPGGACGSSSPSQNVLLPSASARDPLLGACESQAVAQSSSNVLSSTAPSLSLCAERDMNQNAKNVDGDLLVPGRVGEDVCDASNVSGDMCL